MRRTGRGPSRASLVSECGRGLFWRVLGRCEGMWGIDCFRVGCGMLLDSGRLGGRVEGCGLGEGRRRLF